MVNGKKGGTARACPTMGGELDLFNATTQNVQHVRTYESIHNNEVSQVIDNGMMIFRLDESPNWHAFDRSFFVIELKVLKADDSPLGDGGMTSIVDNVGHSLLKQIDFYVNGERLYAMERHDFCFYIQQRLTLAADALKTWPQLHGHHEDTHQHFNSFSDTANTGFKDRRGMIKQGRTVRLYVRPSCFPFNQPRLFPAFVNKHFVITRNTDDFLLLGDAGAPTDGVKIKLENIYLKMENIELLESVHSEMTRNLKVSVGARYPFSMPKFQCYHIPKDTLDWDIGQHALCLPTMPEHILFSLVTEKAYLGDRQENPFRMAHHKVSNFQVTINENDYFPKGGLKTDFGHGDYGELYLNLLRDLGYFQNMQTGPSLTYREFDNDQVFWSIHVANKFPQAINGEMPRHHLNVAIRFAAKLSEHVRLICYPIHQNEIRIKEIQPGVIQGFEMARERPMDF